MIAKYVRGASATATGKASAKTNSWAALKKQRVAATTDVNAAGPSSSVTPTPVATTSATDLAEKMAQLYAEMEELKKQHF